MARSRAVGIDLGTTYSAMAWVDDSNKSTLIPNEEGDLLTPSVVLFEDDQIIVGKEAKKVAVMAVDRVATCVKRDMGKPVYSKPINGQYLPPEVIQSYILRKLKNDIKRVVGPDFQTIITVPAYFDEPRRKATYQAGEMAGLNVLDILNEPTAAALAFGEDQGYLTRFGAPRQRMKVVVYDLGGGTFDVTLIDLQAGDLRTLCTDGDVQLGGYDWDVRLVDYMAEAFIREHHQDPRQSPESHQRMLFAAEEAKHTLSSRQRARLSVPHAGHTTEVEITREQFEQLSSDLLERTRYTTRQLLATSGFEWRDIDRILLTGGSTRMPMSQRMLKELSGMVPDHSVSPDEAVARGAATYANYLLASKGDSGHRPSFDVTNVNAHSLGIEGIDPETQRKRNRILIPRNSPLPAKKTAECVTKMANQGAVVVQVLEGESFEPRECSPIGRTVIRGLPQSLPKGWPVEVCYEYGVNGRLHVRAKVRGTNSETVLELERDESMSTDRLNRWKRVLAAGGGLDAFDLAIQNELQELKSQAPQPTGAVPSVPATPPPMTPSSPGAPGAAGQFTAKVVRPAPAPAPTSAPAPSGVPQHPAVPTTQAVPRLIKPGNPQPQSQPATRPQPLAPVPRPSQLTGNVAFTCPHCRGVFQVSASLAGKQTNCPGCQGALIVPQPPAS